MSGISVSGTCRHSFLIPGVKHTKLTWYFFFLLIQISLLSAVLVMFIDYSNVTSYNQILVFTKEVLS